MAGLTGTPSFVLGRAVESAVEGIRIVDAQPLAAFRAHVRPAPRGRN